eukprot:gene59691-81683_t
MEIDHRSPSLPSASLAFSPPIRGNGRPLSVTATATMISPARGRLVEPNPHGVEMAAQTGRILVTERNVEHLARPVDRLDASAAQEPAEFGANGDQGRQILDMAAGERIADDGDGGGLADRRQHRRPISLTPILSVDVLGLEPADAGAVTHPRSPAIGAARNRYRIL